MHDTCFGSLYLELLQMTVTTNTAQRRNLMDHTKAH